jgi:hypothetical protein
MMIKIQRISNKG